MNIILLIIIIIIIIIIIYLFEIDNINTILSCLDIIVSSNNKDMVISVYNEDINWVKEKIKNYKNIYIYCKNSKRYNIIKQNFNYPNIRIINMKNIGSCDYVYLYHIINNYDNLNNYIHFCKGTKLKNIAYVFLPKFYNCFNNNNNNKLKTFSLNNWTFTNNKNLNLKFKKSNFSNLENYLLSLFTKSFVNNLFQNSIYVIYKGEFTVSKKNIRRYDKKIYEKLKDNDNDNNNTNREIDHFQERIWDYYSLIINFTKNNYLYYFKTNCSRSNLNMDCSICCEKFNKSTHFKIECKTCEDTSITTCRACCKKYLIDNSISPKCMICKVEWDKEFLFDNFTKVFINKELKEIKENVLLEKEISKLADTQEYAEKIKIVRGLEKQKVELHNKEMKYKEKIRKIADKIKDINNSIVTIHSTKVTRGKEFCCKCPIDNCKGFLDSNYICGLCENTICKKCMETKDENHECDNDKIETIKLLKKDTRPCPKCGQLIFKIDGCDQMWCPPCHTTFSWRTGLIEEGNIHNPEYYRWMRENNQSIPRNVGDEPYNPCGNNIIPSHNFLTIIRKAFPYNKTDTVETIIMFNMHRIVGHITDMDRYADIDRTHVNDKLRDLRVLYLFNQLTKESWKSKLQTIDKKQEKERKIIDVWNLLKIVIIEYIGKIVENQNYIDLKIIILNIIQESKNIRKYCNNSFEKIGKIYTCVYPGITQEWKDIDNYKKYLSPIKKK